MIAQIYGTIAEMRCVVFDSCSRRVLSDPSLAPSPSPPLGASSSAGTAKSLTMCRVLQRLQRARPPRYRLLK